MPDAIDETEIKIRGGSHISVLSEMKKSLSIPLQPLEVFYRAEDSLLLVKPVLLCIVVTVLLSRLCEESSYNIILPFGPRAEMPDPLMINETETAGALFGGTGTPMDHLIMLGFLVILLPIMTFMLLLCYKYELDTCLYLWMLGMVFLIFGPMNIEYSYRILSALDISVDYMTAGLIIWNLTIVAAVMQFTMAPLLVQKGLQMFISVGLALHFLTFLPDYLPWALLATLVVWDIFAVLCPWGPLNLLIKVAQERKKPLAPGLLYSTTMVYNDDFDGNERVNSSNSNCGLRRRHKAGSDDVVTGDISDRSSASIDLVTQASSNTLEEPCEITDLTQSDETGVVDDLNIIIDGHSGKAGDHLRKRQRALRYIQDLRELSISSSVTTGQERRRGPKLGLGDFIFYSLLVGKASKNNEGDWNVVLACTCGILVGLVATLALLALYRRALPALPISVMFGILFYFGTTKIITPFMDRMARDQVFI